MAEDENKLRSLSGDPVYYHDTADTSGRPASASEDAPKIWNHISSTLGKVRTVFHEKVSTHVHVDVHIVPPDGERDFSVLVTSGMSDVPMSAPEKFPAYRYAEVCILLPADWPLEHEQLREEKHWWPIRMLKEIARYPHVHQTWVWRSHTIENSGALPYDSSTELCACILSPPVMLPDEFRTCRCSAEKEVHFFSIMPIYREEMRLKLRDGSNALYQAFDRERIEQIIDPRRKNVAC